MRKKLLSDRRGIAVEMAILMTVVCFAISTIVMSTALLQNQYKLRAEKDLKESVIVEQIVEKWRNSMADDVETYADQGYRGMVLWKDGRVAGLEIVQMDEEGNITATILTVAVEDGKISQWKKG